MQHVSDLRTLEVVLNSGCNLACSYCYQSAKRLRGIEWETLRGAVDLLMQSRRRQVNLVFIGGEPLLEFASMRRAVEYARRVRPPGKRIRFITSTNGTLLDDEKAAYLARHRVRTQLSFDGVPAAQDIRGRGTFGTLDRLLDRLRLAHPEFYRKRLAISITLIAKTIPVFPDSIRYFLRKGVSDVAVAPRNTFDPDWKEQSIDALDRAFGAVYRLCLGHYRRTGKTPLALLRHDGGRSIHRPRELQMCGVGSGEMIAVDVDGKAHGCVAFATSYQRFPSRFLATRLGEMALGDFRDPAFRARLAGLPSAARDAEIFDDKQLKYSSYGRCRDCRYLSDCTVCPVSIGHIPGNPDPHRIPDFGCAYNMISLKYRDRFPRQVRARDVLAGRFRIPGLMRDLARFTRPDRPSARRAVR